MADSATRRPRRGRGCGAPPAVPPPTPHLNLSHPSRCPATQCLHLRHMYTYATCTPRPEPLQICCPAPHAAAEGRTQSIYRQSRNLSHVVARFLTQQPTVAHNLSIYLSRERERERRSPAWALGTTGPDTVPQPEPRSCLVPHAAAAREGRTPSIDCPFEAQATGCGRGAAACRAQVHRCHRQEY